MLKNIVVRALIAVLLVGLIAATATGCKKKMPTESEYCSESGNC